MTETKLDPSFPDLQFITDGFRQPYRFLIEIGMKRVL